MGKTLKDYQARPLTFPARREYYPPPTGDERPIQDNWNAAAYGTTRGTGRSGKNEPKAGSSGAPFSQRSLKQNGGSWTVTIWSGQIREIVTSREPDTKAVIFYDVEVGSPAAAMDDADPFEISMSHNDFLYVTYETNQFGEIKGPGSLVVDSIDDGGTHYQPDDENGIGGVDGAYRVKVGQLVVDGSKATLKPFLDSDIEHYHDLWTGKKIGGGSSVYKGPDADADTYEFRTIKGNYGINDSSSGDEVLLDIHAASIGNAHAVLVDPDDPAALTDEPVEFRTIRGLLSTEDTDNPPQIQVSLADGESSDEGAQDTIRIRGNTVHGSISFLDCSETEVEKIEWKDGLITTAGDLVINLGDCSRRGGAGGL